VEQEPGILNAEVFVGFGWADSPHASNSVAVIAEDEAHLAQAVQHARRTAQTMWDRRADFAFDQEVVATVDEALQIALAAPESSVWLTDPGDNPTAGTPGDSTYFLSRMLERHNSLRPSPTAAKQLE
jgi:microcystin degradation protein MlrC